MADIITAADLPASLRAALGELLDMVLAGLNAKASRVAPCLASSPTAGQLAEAKLALVGIAKRWSDAGSGAFTQQTAGVFSVSSDTRQRAGYNLRPDEIEQLQEICKTGSSTGRMAFSVDTAPSGAGRHLPWCNLMFGATYCSCGVDIAGYPIYELDGAP